MDAICEITHENFLYKQGRLFDLVTNKLLLCIAGCRGRQGRTPHLASKFMQLSAQIFLTIWWQNTSVKKFLSLMLVMDLPLKYSQCFFNYEKWCWEVIGSHWAVTGARWEVTWSRSEWKAIIRLADPFLWLFHTTFTRCSPKLLRTISDENYHECLWEKFAIKVTSWSYTIYSHSSFYQNEEIFIKLDEL